MKSIVYILIFLSGLLVDSCAQKRKAGGPSVGQLQSEGLSGEEFDVTKLTPPKVKVFKQNVCMKNGVGDALLRLEIESDQDFDYFNAQLCSRDGNCLDPIPFLDKNYLMAAPEKGSYFVKVQGCLEKQHSKNPELLCGDWTVAETFDFNEVSEQAQNRLQKQENLRQQMTEICKDIRSEMIQFVANETDPQSKLKPIVQKNLSVTSLLSCRDLLISPELALLENLSMILPNESTGQVANAQTIIVENQSNPIVVGYVFMALGIAGLGYTGNKIRVAIETTLSERGEELSAKIILNMKKQKLIEYRNYQVQIDELNALIEEIKKIAEIQDPGKFQGAMDYLSGKTTTKPDINVEQFFEEKSKGLTERIEEEIEKIESLWSNEGGGGPLAALKQKMGADQPDADDLWKFFQKIEIQGTDEVKMADSFVLVSEEKKNAGWFNIEGWKRLVGWGGIGSDPRSAKGRIFDAKIMGNTPFQNLVLLAEEKKRLSSTQARYKECQTNFKLCGESLVSIRDTVAKLEADQAKIGKNWKKSLLALGTATAKGMASGGAKGAFALGTLGGMVGQLLPMGGGLYGAGYGAAAGAAGGSVYGGATEFMKTYEELAPPRLLPSEQAKINKGIEGFEERKTFKENLEAKRLEQDKKLKIEQRSDASMKAKFGAAAPWILGASLSGLAVAVGAYNSFGLASSIQEQFLQNYSRLYQKGQMIQQAYTEIMLDLLYGTCSK